MKSVRWFLCLGLASCLALAEQFDKGGETFDFEAISKMRMAEAEAATGGENLFKNADFSKPFKSRGVGEWSAPCWLSLMKNVSEADKAKAKEIQTVKMVDVDGEKVMELNRPAEAEAFLGVNVAGLRTSACQTVDLGNTDGGLYHLAFDYRAFLYGKQDKHNLVLVYYCGEEKGKYTRGYEAYSVGVASAWTSFGRDIAVPPKTRYLELKFRGDGAGLFQFKHPRLVKAAVRNYPVTVHLTPATSLDNSYAMAKGAPGVMSFKFRNNAVGKRQYNVALNLELPEGFDIIGTSCFYSDKIAKKPLDKGGKAWNLWTLNMTNTMFALIANSGDFYTWHMPSILLTTTAEAHKEWRGCAYYLTSFKTGEQLSDREEFLLKTVEDWKPTAPATLFLGGFTSPSYDLIFQQPAAVSAIAKFIGETGSQIAGITHVSKEYYDELHKNGVRFVTMDGGSICNGFTLGGYDKKTPMPGADFLDKAGKPVFSHGSFATCPAAVYLRTPFYKDFLMPRLLKAFETHDGIHPNWEPYMFNAQGCFCDTCCAEYAKWSKQPLEEVKKGWPEQYTPGFPGREKIIPFRAWQHGQSIKTMNEDVVKTTGKTFGICPEVGTDQIIQFPTYTEKSGDFTPYAYADSLEWLNVWGPYIWYDTNQPFVYMKGANVRYFEQIGRASRDYRKAYPDRAKAAKLMAMPQGRQGDAIAQPEGMLMDQISAWLVGFDSSILYFFPRGYDIRFWMALSKSIDVARIYGDMVRNGVRTDCAVVKPVTPFASPVANVSPVYMPDVAVSELLRSVTYAKDGKLLVAVANFWNKGDAVYRLSIPGLEPKTRYAVNEAEFERSYVDGKARNFTGKELSEGILLHIGAQRWSFLDILPGGKTLARKVKPAELTALAEKLNGELAPAKHAEDARDQALRAENDPGHFDAFKSGALEGKPLKLENGIALELVNGKTRMVFQAFGFCVESLAVDGRELFKQFNGASGFWTPGPSGALLLKQFRVAKQCMTSKGLELTGELKISNSLYSQMYGAKLVKKVVISKDLKKVSFAIDIINTNEDALTNVGYRWQFQPTAWGAPYNGEIRYQDGTTAKRPCSTLLLAMKSSTPGEQKTIGRIFNITKPVVSVAGNVFEFVAEGMAKARVRVLPQESFHGVAIWDTPDMSRATFEPYYESVTIAPGAKVSYEAEMTLGD